ncbi:MAG: 50S ribosomal protein L9 [Bacteriovoracaceae bacterium]|nr:50S ribosomal protein L9 [Bacteriovoracaceae bacterium]
MKVILTEKVKALGNVGEIVNVSVGYARNFLIPNKLGTLVDANSKTILANQQKKLAGKVNQAKAAAESMKGKLQGLTLSFTKRIAANGKLFGTVSPSEIVKELEKMGISVERKFINIPSAIKSVGTFDVVAKVFDGIEAAFKVKVELDPKQVEELKAAQAAGSSKKKRKADAAAAAAAAEVAGSAVIEGEPTDPADAESEEA